jgi:Fe-S cluster assembly protein SufD
VSEGSTGVITHDRGTAAAEAPSIESYITAYNARAQQRSDPHWLKDIRARGINHFRSAGFPTTRDEDWHFTSSAPIAERTFKPVVHSGSIKAAELRAIAPGAESWNTLVFVDGVFNEQLSSYAGLADGVSVETFGHTLREGDLEPPMVERIGMLARPEKNAFNGLNSAFFADGTIVRVKPDVVVADPIHILNVATIANALISPRTLVVVEHHASVSIVESFVSLTDGTYLTNAVTEIFVADNARVDHLKVQEESIAAYHVGTTEVFQERDSAYTSFSFASGGALSRTNIYTVLSGEGASATLNGLYTGDGTQHIDHQTRIEHVAPNCKSWEVYKGILDGEAHGVFNGKVYVHPEAQKTDGKQSNNNLLLSERARVDTKPQLEIFADDVKCTHGATVGRLDERAMFYCQSRGIPAAQAKTLLTYAFAADILQQIPLDPLRHGLEQLIMERVGPE